MLKSKREIYYEHCLAINTRTAAAAADNVSCVSFLMFLLFWPLLLKVQKHFEQSILICKHKWAGDKDSELINETFLYPRLVVCWVMIWHQNGMDLFVVLFCVYIFIFEDGQEQLFIQLPRWWPLRWRAWQASNVGLDHNAVTLLNSIRFTIAEVKRWRGQFGEPKKILQFTHFRVGEKCWEVIHL